ncbi:hypothetical protein FNV43_RR15033 [Rhamnella rubrinervis]|uniref:GTP-eEF1A C-terminal domain-containing protein n=1 Tax=Rhamnella rubrinervis TaxID=2594499 RepID=A0A8K0E0S9_9ROSA|nr:hypothetical protein FNV43_RR15033 [Rhamnella rubrinervis]
MALPYDIVSFMVKDLNSTYLRAGSVPSNSKKDSTRNIELVSGVVLNIKPTSLKCGHRAIVKMRPRNSMAEEFKKYPALECFTIGKEDVTISFGIIKSIKNGYNYSTDIIPFVPIFAAEDENITGRSNKLDWYHGTTLVEVIEWIKEPKTLINKALHFAFYYAERIRIYTANTIEVGCVEAEIFKANIKISDIFSFTVKDLNLRYLRARSVASDPKKDSALKVESFVSQVVIMNSFNGEINQGDVEVMDCNLSYIVLEFSKILDQIDPVNGVVLKTRHASLKCGDTAMVRMRPKNPMVEEEFNKYLALGCFTIYKEGVTTTFGIIKSVEKTTKGVKCYDKSLM